MLDLNLTSYAGLIAAGAAISVIWNRGKQIFRLLTSPLICRTSIEQDYDVVTALIAFMRRNCTEAPSTVQSVSIRKYWLGGRQTFIPFKFRGGSVFYYSHYGLFLVDWPNYTISHLRGTAKVDQLLVDLSVEMDNANSNEKASRFRIKNEIGSVGDRFKMGGNKRGEYEDSATPSSEGSSKAAYFQPSIDWPRALRYDKETLTAVDNEDPFNGLFYDEGANKLLENLKEWFNNRAFYEERSIPWRTGVILHGPAGTGKSSFALATAKTLRIPIVRFFLSTMSDADFISAWRSLPTPCVVVFEDFTEVFHLRENITELKALTFDTILNCLSGIDNPAGILTMLSTNNLELIDAAMGTLDARGVPTRPGRIEYIQLFGYSTTKQREEISKHVLQRIDPSVYAEGDITPNQFQSECVKLALLEMHQQKLAA